MGRAVLLQATQRYYLWLIRLEYQADREAALPLRPFPLWMLETEPIGSHPKHLATANALIAPRP